jgi:hypothetical protein
MSRLNIFIFNRQSMAKLAAVGYSPCPCGASKVQTQWQLHPRHPLMELGGAELPLIIFGYEGLLAPPSHVHPNHRHERASSSTSIPHHLISPRVGTSGLPNLKHASPDKSPHTWQTSCPLFSRTLPDLSDFFKQTLRHTQKHVLVFNSAC